ncbi:MAG TPA: DUF393 domain-containing protein [Pseudidiomarina sp.]|nr:DUF393 domain-containing protein [Pseudidiomarina sp.]
MTLRHPDLIIFYDGGCPLCLHEMRQLRKRDPDHRIQIEDILADDFPQRFPQIDPVQADRMLHGQLADGTVIYGLDVTHKAWSLVGRGWLTAPLRWPLIRVLTDWIYLWFARHRNTISRVLTGNERCSRCRID